MFDPVGRTWYLRLQRGTIAGIYELGTHHLSSGTQVWDLGQWHCPADPMSEREVLDELYVVLMKLFEARC